MPFCVHCGTEYTDDAARFCSHCGLPLPNRAVAPLDSSGHTPETRKIKFAGELVKCPNCGELVPSFSTTCPSCGWELRGDTSVSRVKELEQRLAALQIQDNSKDHEVARALGLAGLPQNDQRAVNLIETFAIPNTKEDILEFMFTASSNIDPRVINGIGGFSGYDNASDRQRAKAYSQAWLSKMDQCYQKAEVSLSGTRELLQIEEIYKNVHSKIDSAPFKSLIHLACLVLIMLLPVLLLCIYSIAYR